MANLFKKIIRGGKKGEESAARYRAAQAAKAAKGKAKTRRHQVASKPAPSGTATPKAKAKAKAEPKRTHHPDAKPEAKVKTNTPKTETPKTETKSGRNKTRRRPGTSKPKTPKGPKRDSPHATSKRQRTQADANRGRNRTLGGAPGSSGKAGGGPIKRGADAIAPRLTGEALKKEAAKKGKQEANKARRRHKAKAESKPTISKERMAQLEAGAPLTLREKAILGANWKGRRGKRAVRKVD